MDCDRIARPYRWFEYGTFGRALERHRFLYVPKVQETGRALLLADGDGRFACELVKQNRTVHIDSIDISEGMVKQAARRIARLEAAESGRIRLRQGDVFVLDFESDSYDLIVTNFFFDCFSSTRIEELVKRIRPAGRRGAFWIVTEFRQPTHGWRAWHARLWLTVMYLFFRATAGLKNSHLADHHAGLRSAGLSLLSSYTSRAGLISSELWELR